ncbi:HpcH/HpaI aldolase/citrate lyase family protein [Kordiimonas aquimaris]|uniref:HpcH/HpaI aldolase/citrate lyase family protein n=1 Tax=Kordiimonas aquimaris TaxID=707591 RepID=UPI0021D0D138|nr:CoA ester lyase [Kordiimonas aquimaris]
MVTPRRSVLFMPGSNARAHEKAKTIDADTIVFDLEDAVAPSAKSDARSLVLTALSSDDYGHRERVVRINGTDTDWWQEDIAAIAKANPSAIVVPKVETPETIVHVVAEITRHAPNNTSAIWVMMETPLGFLNAADIASGHPRLTTLVIGTNDLVKDLRASHTKGREPVITALGMALLAGRAHNLTVLDGVYNDFNDDVGLAAECKQACAMGFDGKTLIHPAQVDTANRIFAPDAAAIDEAKRMIEAFTAAKAEGKGVTVLDGRMIEELHLVEARRVTAMAEAIKER